jgi:serine/threonine protein kinase
MGLFDFLFGGKTKKGGKVKLPVINVKNRFDLLNRTGQGSMSKVWRARDRSLGRTVCLKLLDREKTAKFESRFLGLNKPLEGAICMVLRHPNIVQTFEYGMTTDKEYYLVMELVEGMGMNFLVETHNEKLNGNRINFLRQLANALEYMHKQGFMHRDLCPRNVMVTNEDVVKLIDFGLTIPLRPEFCKPGNRTGTTNYLAPELIRRVTTDQRVDLFALGVTAYELFTFTLPWEKGESMQTLHSHVNRAGTDPREHAPKMDKATAQFLIKAIERDPNKRFQRAAEFREALDALPQGQ